MRTKGLTDEPGLFCLNGPGDMCTDVKIFHPLCRISHTVGCICHIPIQGNTP